MISWAAFMPIFGKKRRALETTAARVGEAEYAARTAIEELQRLRAYVNSRMEEHFRVYSGGMLEQMKTLATLALPTPWVPTAIMERDYPLPTDFPIARQTWIRETRMVPLRDAGKI